MKDFYTMISFPVFVYGEEDPAKNALLQPGPSFEEEIRVSDDPKVEQRATGVRAHQQPRYRS